MISRIINFAKTIGSKIPIIRNFISTTREDEKKKNELIAKKISENEKKEFVLIRTPNNNKTIKHLERFLQSENNRVMRSNVSNFEEIFKINLNKISNLNSIE